MFKASLETREQFQARTMKRPDLYPKRISWAAFMALCHRVQPKPSEAGIVIVYQWNKEKRDAGPFSETALGWLENQAELGGQWVWAVRKKAGEWTHVHSPAAA